MSIFNLPKQMSDHALAVNLDHYKAQQKTASRWVAAIVKEQKRRKRERVSDAG
jgi:hypothetical protein